MIIVRLTTSASTITTELSAPGRDIILDLRMCAYCDVEPVEVPKKFCCDNHRTYYFKKQIAQYETPSVAHLSSIPIKTPA